MEDPACLSFPTFTSPTVDIPPLPKDFGIISTKQQNTLSQHTIIDLSRTSSCVEISEKPALQDEAPYISDADMSPLFTSPTMDFAGLFPDTPVDDSFPLEDSSSAFVSLFNLYLETHRALTEIRSGIQEVSIADLKDGHGMIRTVISINELGTTMINTHASSTSPCMLFAFITILKSCELVEQISTTILPSTRQLIRSDSTDSVTTDYIWTTCSPMLNGHPEFSAEHITALVRLDIHLSQSNHLISLFTQLTQEQGLSANVLAMQCQKRLLHLHTQIRSVVDSMIPAWD